MWVFRRNTGSTNSYEVFAKEKPSLYASAYSSGKPIGRYPTRKIYIMVCMLVFGIVYLIVNAYSLGQSMENSLATPVHKAKTIVPVDRDKPVVWIYGTKPHSGHLAHVFAVFEKVGFNIEYGPEAKKWDILWSHEYPFRELAPEMSKLRGNQKVNHFPGSGYITNKVSLASSDMKYIPPAFSLPGEKGKFLNYVSKSENQKKMWVQKDGNHRGIEVRKVEELDLGRTGSFIQQYIHNPYLIDGHKFDIGVYVTLTSVNPLRVYVYETDMLLRFCIDKYHPFNSKNLDSYVVGDDYLPVWKVPSLKYYYTKLNNTAKDSLKAFMVSQGKDFNKIWSEIKESIKQVYLKKKKNLVSSTKQYPSTHHFFEMVRFDFILDEDLNVFIMEANMSPNLSSLHFSQNKLLYEQVIFNMLSVVGLVRFGSRLKFDEMKVSDRDLQVSPEVCYSSMCLYSCNDLKCQICNQCLTSDFRSILTEAYLEHLSRWNTRRIIPGHFPQDASNMLSDNTKESPFIHDALLNLWFQAKCQQDSAWCN